MARENGNIEKQYVVDLRSDCLSQPTPEMFEAMKEVTLRDDVFNEDPTIHELQDKMAEMFGMEAALFVPSGTMGNLIAVLCHCHSERGLEVIVGDCSHTLLHEQGGIAALGGIHTRQVSTEADGTFDLEKLEDYIRPKHDPHEPWTALVCIENTHSMKGGRVLKLDYLQKLRSFCKERDIPIHMDGARLMNAAVSLDIPVCDILQYVDSVNMCFSKGIGTPIGSIIAGKKDFIARGLRLRKMLGGGMRQPGILAAAALHCMKDARERLTRDMHNARKIAKVIQNNCGQNMCLGEVESNIIHIIMKTNEAAKTFQKRLAEVKESDSEKVVVKVGNPIPRNVRLVMYSSLTDEDVDKTSNKIKQVLEEIKL